MHLSTCAKDDGRVFLRTDCRCREWSVETINEETVASNAEVSTEDRKKKMRKLAKNCLLALGVCAGAGVIAFLGIKNKEVVRECKILQFENRVLRERVANLEGLCREKDSFFVELASDAMRHGSSLGAQHMVGRREYLAGR